MLFTIDQTETDVPHAGNKARSDASSIMNQMGFEQIWVKCSISTNPLNIIKDALSIPTALRNAINSMSKGDVFVIQFPYRCFMANTGKEICRLAKKRGIKSIALIHDLDSIRYSESGGILSSIRNDLAFLRDFDKIIVHNEKMANYLYERGFSDKQIIELGLFDYLSSHKTVEQILPNKNLVSVAGNLSEGKAGYLYKLDELNPAENLNINLFGNGYTCTPPDFCKYKGTFPPKDLPSQIKTGFGLVWDGDSIETCHGEYGNYLRYNNPHKLSLYYSCGIPSIVWRESATANFVEKTDSGICIDSIRELPKILDSLPESRYASLKDNACLIQDKVTSGYFLKTALEEALA